jgi:hypothetical protein
MTKIITWILIVALIVGGIASWDLIPKSWFDRVPAIGQIALVTCAVIFSTIILIGYVLDSGIPQKIFKRK